ncbi:hypothetical protein LTR50_004766 [Elasticomyces elasticus]|nr:hypothetical protein LTR50_004766 [Elasticomyces elasticus]
MWTAITLALVPLLGSLANAQQYSINPDSVSQSTRNYWCTSQQTQCPLICLQTPGNSAATNANTCDPVGLTYNCICSNGIAPNASEYSQTLPYFICTEWGNQCVAACGQNNGCASNCRSNHPCGAQNPTRVNLSTISSTMSSTGTGVPAGASTGASGTVYTGFGGSAQASATAGGSKASGSSVASGGSAVAALDLGRSYGVVVVVAAFFGGFALLL